MPSRSARADTRLHEPEDLTALSGCLVARRRPCARNPKPHLPILVIRKPEIYRRRRPPRREARRRARSSARRPSRRQGPRRAPRRSRRLCRRGRRRPHRRRLRRPGLRRDRRPRRPRRPEIRRRRPSSLRRRGRRRARRAVRRQLRATAAPPETAASVLRCRRNRPVGTEEISAKLSAEFGVLVPGKNRSLRRRRPWARRHLS